MNVKLCVIFVFASTLLRSAEGILNADPVKIEDFSYNVAVSYKYDFDTTRWYQSGSIVHKRFILTDGSSFVNVTWNADKSFVKSIRLRSIIEIKVQALTDREVIGYPELEKNAIIEKVKTLHYPQECFNSNKAHGRVVILELQNDLELSRGIQVLKLPPTDLNYMNDYEKFAVFTSFGRYLKETHGIRLRSMEVAIVDCPRSSLEASDWSTFCGGSIILQQNINHSHNQSLGAYWGDQGGPLVYRKNTIIGMMDSVNDGDHRLGQNHLASFINISRHFDFINDVISGQPSLHVIAAIPLS